MADRFFIDGPIALDWVSLTGEEAHHLANVRRFRVGDQVELFNGDGLRYHATVVQLSKREVELEVTGTEESRSENRSPCWVASALPKGDRFDFLLEKLTELGVTDFIPLITERSVVIPRSEKQSKWRRAVIEASKQCGRDRLMNVHEPLTLTELFGNPVLPSRKLIAHPGGKGLPKLSSGDGVAFAVGPEGGFTDAEVAEAASRGWEPIAIGPRILRIETAAVALATYALIRQEESEFDDTGGR